MRPRAKEPAAAAPGATAPAAIWHKKRTGGIFGRKQFLPPVISIETILQPAGTDLQHVLRCGIFLIDMTEFKDMNAVYERMFGDHRPARTTIQAAALPPATGCASRSTASPISPDVESTQ